jgi:hypothetical protein
LIYKNKREIKELSVNYLCTKMFLNYQSLVDSVVIDAELGRRDHNSIPATAIEKGLESLNPKPD